MKLRSFVLAFLLTGSVAKAASSAGGLGLNVGLGVPFLTQAGIDYMFNSKFGISAGYNLLDLDVGTASVKLSMPEVLLNYHPFGGSFFLAAGVGSEKLETSASDSGGNSVSGEVSATTTIAKVGWKWGLANGGFWFGVDFSYIAPNGGDPTITNNGVSTSDPAYTDLVEALDKYADTSYGNITIARLGWVF